MLMRQSGILMHITSLPGKDGIGSLGQEARDFADFLHKAGMKLWQVLPVGPVGYGESPYQSSSVFAGNPLMISLEELRREGLLDDSGLPAYVDQDPAHVDYDQVRIHKEGRLRLCFRQSGKKMQGKVEEFARSHPWAEDVALFTAVKHHFGDAMWTKWPEKDIRLHKEEAVLRYKAKLAEDVQYHLFVQMLFFRQWMALKKYCNDLGLMLFGDMPIYVAEDSADTWTHPEVFQLDRNRIPKRVAGVPPDYFSEDGQLWGNPLYRWHYLRLTGYRWWVERMKAMTTMYDMIRIDHFIGFANYYSIPYGAPNARNGKWVIGPGKSLFKTFRKKLPGIRIVAEDLGCVNDRVRSLLKFVGYPGMRVLCFGFGGGDDNMHLPQHYVENSVVYTGTHDNDTVRGWVDTADEKSLTQAKQLLGFEKKEDAPEAFIRCLLASKADTAVIPMQDVLGLDTSARMNLPGSIGGNWRWRMLPGAAADAVALHLKELNQLTNREAN